MRTSGASRWSASHSVLTSASGLAYVIFFSLRQRDDEPAVHLALVLDLGAFDAADLRRVGDMGAAAGLQVDAVDPEQPDFAGTHRRPHTHCLHQLGPARHLLVGDPL